MDCFFTIRFFLNLCTNRIISNMSEIALHSSWLGPHISFCHAKRNEMTSFVSVCVFYLFGVCECRRMSLPTTDSAQMAVAVVCVYTLLSICVSIYLGVAWKTCSLLALCCFFSSSGTHTHACTHKHTHTDTHTGCIFSWLGAWDIL